MPMSLTASDLESLRYRWIDPQTAESAALARVDDAEGRERMGRSKGSYAGIFIPYLRAGHTIAYRIRRDAPEMEASSDGSFKEKAKYVNPPGQPNHLYYHPAAEILLKDKLPIVITEGEFKTLALHRLSLHQTSVQRFCALGIAGVWNWRGTVGKTGNAKGARVDVKGAIPDLDTVSWEGRTVYIAFDADVREKELVQIARANLTKELQKRKAAVGYLEWDFETWRAKGIDDFLYTAGPDAVLRHLESVTPRTRQIEEGSNFKVTDGGVYYIDPESPKARYKICGRLDIVSRTRNTDSDDWGVLVRWRDHDDVEHAWAIPMSLLQGDDVEVRKRLAAGGLDITPTAKAKMLLNLYLNTTPTEARLTCVDKLGWFGDDTTFVLPNRTIGPLKEEVVLQNQNIQTPIRQSGELDEWKKYVGRYARKNSRLMLSICAGFAGPLLRLTGENSGGIHFKGHSSLGKSTLLIVGGSVLGGTDKQSGFCQTWRATTNGLESIAEDHNHLTLFLDEISQCSAYDVQEVAYMLGNGEGKGRMTRQILGRRKPSWTLLFVSSGEVTLREHGDSAGVKTKAGAEIRLLNILADAECGHGVYEHLHDAASGADLSNRLMAAARAYYGTPFITYLRWLTENRKKADKIIEDTVANIKGQIAKGAIGEIQRAAQRFAIVAAAGEISTAAGCTGWETGESYWATTTCFKSWRELRGTLLSGDQEAVAASIRNYIQRWDARFQTSASHVPLNRAGFKQQGAHGMEYLFLSEPFREACAPCDPKQAAKILAELGYLERRDPERYTWKPRVFGEDPQRVYVILSSILE